MEQYARPKMYVNVAGDVKILCRKGSKIGGKAAIVLHSFFFAPLIKRNIFGCYFMQVVIE